MHNTNLINHYKRDYWLKTGEVLQVFTITPLQAICQLPVGLDFEDAVNQICKNEGWNKKNIFAKLRMAPLPRQREILYTIAYNNDWDQREIATIFNRERSTVSHSLTSFAAKLKNDPKLNKYLEDIMARLRASVDLEMPESIKEESF